MNNLVSERGYWLFGDKETVAREHVFDERFCKALIDFYAGASVVDFGCGTGDYVRAFRAAGMAADGWDGNPNTPSLAGGTCGVVDLSREVWLKQPYEWVQSLEVGEHIPAAYERTFLDNLARNCKRGVVLSWAVVPQGVDAGLGHVNNKPNVYIRNQMLARGFVCNFNAEAKLRSAATCSHFPNTLMVFDRLDVHGRVNS